MQKKVEDKLWEHGINATPTAVAIDNLVRPVRIALAPIFNELEQKHGLSISISCTGVVAMLDGDVVYEKGKYVPVQAKGREQCAQYRAFAYGFLRWCSTHYPTNLIQVNKGWIYGSRSN